jgi:hypothetical protein
MLSDIQIDDFEKYLGLPLVGCFSKDLLPDEKQIGDYYINLQNSTDGDGTHWTFAKIFDNKQAVYFDPFGVFMPEEVRQFLKPFAPVAYNTRQIQAIEQETCGHYCEACSYFLKYDFDKRKSVVENFYDFINMFSDNHHSNNKILKEYLEKNCIK